VNRRVPEWIGATPDTRIPDRVRVRVFLAYNGTCHWSGRAIHPGDPWDVDHVIALANGGENRESNLAPILRSKHPDKTRHDVRQKARDARVRKKHLGLSGARWPMPGSRKSGWYKPLHGPARRR
jgi:5-methylcytosine-specific restriction endonuclease McrA